MSEMSTTTTTTTIESPLVTINQISLSGKQIWGAVLAIVALLTTGFTGGYLFVPAKASAVDELSAVVITMQQQHGETRAQLSALTVEVGKLTGAVGELSATVSELRAQRAAASTTRTPSRPSPARRAVPSAVPRSAAPGN